MANQPETIRCYICDTEVDFEHYSAHLELCQYRTFSIIVITLVERSAQRPRFDPLHMYEMMLQFNDLDSYENNLFLQELVGNVPVSIKDVNTVSSIAEDCMKCNEMCPICLEQFVKEMIVRKTVCGHMFCEACLTEWLAENVKCPCCMQDLRTLI